VLEVEQAADGVLLQAEAARERGPGDAFRAQRLVEGELRCALAPRGRARRAKVFARPIEVSWFTALAG